MIGANEQKETMSDYGDKDATEGDTNTNMIEGRPQSELR